MRRKVSVEILPDAEEEIHIRCRELTPEIRQLIRFAESGEFPRHPDSLCLRIGNEEFFIGLGDILFFEASDHQTAVHTVDRMYYSEKTLTELTDLLPLYFTRVSKSCILNLRKIRSLKREVTGIGEATFGGCEKKVFISRMYYKVFRERLEEIRLYDNRSSSSERKE